MWPIVLSVLSAFNLATAYATDSKVSLFCAGITLGMLVGFFSFKKGG